MSLSSPASPRESIRRNIADCLLDALEALVHRHRALALDPAPGGEQVDLHAELIIADMAHELALARSALQWHPPLRRG
ncbi:hypothetical protein [Pseudonocardia alaniniphila]|uniref:Uncharacterized protein n=1 Tax=Pseudonocardia alaniniphila TaxID=75291 RepID=A0ABS9TUR6_9PSEU|nr:hypothetical protein [Pseudonocardia alaniniphila]MCH6172304.1 hypothetical protein [Pseudonocardia alaniniphila]